MAKRERKSPTPSKPGSRKKSPSTNKPATPNKSTIGKKPSKSIVNQRQTPWTMIVTTFVIAAFAIGIVWYAVANRDSSSGSSDNPYTQPMLAAVKSIDGVTYKKEPDHTHKEGVIKYDSTPPVGGNHSQYWADCSGTVYKDAIANENAVHMLEHGAIWVTYNAKTLPAAQLTTLQKMVQGVDRMALSPYPDLKTPISLQAWGYQLFVDSADDPRIPEFVNALRYNPKITPEYGASCSQPDFITQPSTFGHPLWVPADGGSGGTMQ
jgi:hypothetical protein